MARSACTAGPRIRPQRHTTKTFLLGLVAGVVYFHAFATSSSLPFDDLPNAIAPSFQARQGFTSALRWIENLSSREELVSVMVMADQLREAEKTLHNDPSRRALHVDKRLSDRVAAAAFAELPMNIGKMLLQWSLLLFQVRLHVLSRRWAIFSLCLCALILICSQIPRSIIAELLSGHHKPPLMPATPQHSQAGHLEAMATMLNALFLMRHASGLLVNCVMGRAYQVYFCDQWPDKWKRIPGYFGSKNLVVSTLFFTTAALSLMSISARELRSLSEASARIEFIALGVSLLHFLYFHTANFSAGSA